jgi:acetylornithine deacetylase/succinyl-diaminopimelate desuccinylase-like protein
MPEAMGDEAVAVLQRLLRFDTVNPPGRERPAQEYVAGVLREAGLDVVLAGPEPERPNLVARLRGAGGGPSLGLLSHVDTVGADPAGWRHDPWSGDLADGCVWGRGALDMKSQTAAEVVAACALARSGRRLAGDVVVICVADEEVGGTGAEWLCEHRPDLVRCDFLLGEGDGAQTDVGGQRLYGVSVADKGVFRFTLTTEGAAGHASIPTIADNALLKLAPLLQRMADRRPAWDVTAGARALLGGLGIPLDGDPAAALDALREYAPAFAPLVEPMLRVTLAPTMAAASREYNVIPAEAQLFVDCRVPPGMEERAVVARVREVLGDDGYRMEFTETVTGNESPADSPLMDALLVGPLHRSGGDVPAHRLHRLLRFADVPGGLRGPGRVRLLPPPAHARAGRRRARPRAGRAHRRSRPGAGGGLLPVGRARPARAAQRRTLIARVRLAPLEKSPVDCATTRKRPERKTRTRTA